MDEQRRRSAPVAKSIEPTERTMQQQQQCGDVGVSEDDEAKVPNLNNGDLSPPVLEPMYASSNVKSSKNDILGPPPLIAAAVTTNKKPFAHRPKCLLEEESGRWADSQIKLSFRHLLNPDVSYHL